MPGFFKKEEVMRDAPKRLSCLICGLYRGCKSPKMKAHGEGLDKIFHLAEAPGANEDEQNEQLVGKSGRFYAQILREECGHILNKGGRKMNACNCRPPDNETPTSEQIACCRKLVREEIKKFQPKLVILIGGPAVESWLGDRVKEENVITISKWRGYVIPDHDHNCWVCPINHPAYIQRIKNNPAAELIFRQDLVNAFSYLNKPLPNPIERSGVRVLTDQDLIYRYLQRIIKQKPPFLAFDYETTGLKPQMKGHEIRCVSLCWNRAFSISFNIWNLNLQNLSMFKRILQDSDIGKIVQNMKYEYKWSQVILGVEVKGWKFDPMLYSHVEDNRPGVCGLKFQAIVRYGVWDYNSHISHLLEGVGNKGANNFNRIKEIPEQDLLQYCGMDGLIEFNLAMDMMEEAGYV